uniref:Uncharacterized protein n=1 Tax=Eptatretus burgeri TaxID=7764 RepID=A0A8C4QEB9_EPTBU
MSEDFWGLQLQEDDDGADRQEEIERENELRKLLSTALPELEESEELSSDNVSQTFEADDAEFGAHGYMEGGGFRDKKGYSEDNCEEAQNQNGDPDIPHITAIHPSRAIIASWQIDAGASHGCDDLQREFLNPHIGNEGLQMAQLRIMYEARGRESARLAEQLEVLRDESERQTRVLNHQLALVSGEKQGLVVSLEECQKRLQTQQDKGAELEGQICALEAHNKALVVSKNEVIGKLKVAEAAVESLQQQLLLLESSESLARSREHYESRMTILKEEHVQMEAKLLEERQQRKDRELAQVCEMENEFFFFFFHIQPKFVR